MDTQTTAWIALVWIISGLKGGVSKSATALLLLYYLQKLGRPVILIELDSSNPDVAEASRELVERESLFRLDVTLEAAWDTVADIIEAHPGHAIVVNLPAQCERSVQTNVPPLLAAGLTAKFHTIWALGPSRDSTLALERYLALQTGEPVFVMRALFMVDDPADFEPFDDFRTRQLRRLGVDPHAARASDEFARSVLRGGAVLDHMKSPYQMRSLMFDGQEIDGAIHRFSIARIIKEGPKLTKSRTELFVQKMTAALDVLTESIRVKQE